MQDSGPSGAAVLAVLSLLLAPAVAAVGFGVWNPVGAVEQQMVLAATTRLGEAVEVAPPLLHGLGLLVPAALVGLLVGLGSRFRAMAGVELLLHAVGAVGAAGLFAVGAGLDRPVFWAGIAVAAIAGRAEWGAVPAGSTPAWVRGLTAAGAVALAGAAGLTLLEGPSMHSPAFRLRDVWLPWLGSSPWLSGGFWAVVGAGAWATVRATGRGGHGGMLPSTYAVPVVVASAWGLPAHLATAKALSAAGLMLLAWSVGPASVRWVRDSLRSGPGGRLDPRRLATACVPLVAWTAICALRGLTVGMWTVPAELPPGVEQLVARQDLFSLAHDPATDGVLYTDRERDVLGLWSESVQQTWDIWDPGGVGVEEVGAPVGRTAWVSVAGDESSGVVAVDLDGSQGAYVRMPGCWVSDWIPRPGSGEVLIPCESNPVARWFDPAAGRRTGVLSLAHEVETAVFHPDGDRFYAVGLWHTPSVIAYAVPSGEVLGERRVGPFNWALALAGDRLWVSRFFEGGALVLDAETLEVEDRVRLSFGVRALIHEPVHDRIWAAAAYSGVLWSLDAKDPSDRVAYALCGQARDLAADSRGRVFVATDCGLFRVDPAAR